MCGSLHFFFLSTIQSLHISLCTYRRKRGNKFESLIKRRMNSKKSGLEDCMTQEHSADLPRRPYVYHQYTFGMTRHHKWPLFKFLNFRYLFKSFANYGMFEMCSVWPNSITLIRASCLWALSTRLVVHQNFCFSWVEKWQEKFRLVRKLTGDLTFTSGLRQLQLPVVTRYLAIG